MRINPLKWQLNYFFRYPEFKIADFFRFLLNFKKKKLASLDIFVFSFCASIKNSTSDVLQPQSKADISCLCRLNLFKTSGRNLMNIIMAACEITYNYYDLMVSVSMRRIIH